VGHGARELLVRAGESLPLEHVFASAGIRTGESRRGARMSTLPTFESPLHLSASIPWYDQIRTPPGRWR
jgi:hypothetical protein